MSLRKRFILALLLPAASTVLVAATAYWALNVSITASESVRELSAAQSSYRQLITALIDAETGERGYVITGDPAFLEPYNNAQRRIESAIRALPHSPGRPASAQHAQDSGVARAEEIDNLYTRWRVTVAEPVIAARRRHPPMLQELASDVLRSYQGFQVAGAGGAMDDSALETLESLLRRGARLAEAAPTAIDWREALNRLADYREARSQATTGDSQSSPDPEPLRGKLVQLIAATAEADEAVVAPVRSGRGKALMDRLRNLIDDELKTRQAELTELLTHNQRTSHRAELVVAGGVIVAMLGGVAVSVVLMLGLDRRLRRLTNAAERIAEGDLSHRLTVEGEDELAQLTRGFNRMAEDLQHRYLQTELLDRFGQTLQACRDVEEAQTAAARFGPRLFPGTCGALYLTSASRTMTEVTARWGAAPERLVISPSDCWAMREGRVHYFHGDGAEMACAHLSEPPPTESLCAPLVSQGEALGFLYLAVADAGARLPENERQLAATVAEQLGLALANLQLRESLRAQSIRDPLTTLFNRRYLEETLAREIARARREDDELSLLVVDVDHFKQFNDEFGHDAGDAVLASVGALLSRDVRTSDVAARYGGEEFVLVLSGQDMEAAMTRAETIRGHVEQLQVTHHRQTLGPVTISIGVASFPLHAAAPSELLAAADQALYCAKHEGRNRVCAAASERIGNPDPRTGSDG